MNRHPLRPSALLLLASAVLFTAGCSTATTAIGDCVDLCNQAKACPGAPTSDCNTSCSAAAALSAAAGCPDEYDAVTACQLAQTNLCNQGSCQTQQIAWSTCTTSYCATHPSDPGCKA